MVFVELWYKGLCLGVAKPILVEAAAWLVAVVATMGSLVPVLLLFSCGGFAPFADWLFVVSSGIIIGVSLTGFHARPRSLTHLFLFVLIQ